MSEEHQAYRIETSTAASELRQATLTLRRSDLRPVEERLEFSNQEWVEITESRRRYHHLLTRSSAGSG